jgi:hypothetical protein
MLGEQRVCELAYAGLLAPRQDRNEGRVAMQKLEDLSPHGRKFVMDGRDGKNCRPGSTPCSRKSPAEPNQAVEWAA